MFRVIVLLLLVSGAYGIYNTPCDTESYSWWTWENGAKTGAAVAFGVVAVAAAPVALSAVGFTSLGVAAGSIAASVQAPVTVAGSWFALAQSAGMAGLGLGAKAAIFGAVSSASRYAESFICNNK